ncbi:hypothetical protein EDC01DRAFT_385761 [Geopyxis carbonaria]|nr:hypothetical protein EDC01DRAFT_385761 [Geopyxis carbonaria]
MSPLNTSRRTEEAYYVEHTRIAQSNMPKAYRLSWSSSARILLPRVIAVIAFFTLIAPADATNFRFCCIKRAREIRHTLPLGTRDPYSACGLGLENTTVIPETYNPSINATKQWCSENCPGFEKSGRLDLVTAITTWLAPALAFLFLCTTQETPISIGRALAPPKDWYTDIKEGRILGLGHRTPVLWFWSYVSILGDPASAIGGAFLEVAMNFHMARKLTYTHRDSRFLNISRNCLLAVLVLIGQLEPEKPPVSTESNGIQAVRSVKEAPDKMMENKRAADKRKEGIALVLYAKKDFALGVAFPCVLAVAVAAGTYSSAYQKKGDVKTSLDLSYSVCYTWLLLLAVSSNCHISALNATCLNRIFESYGVWPDGHRGSQTVALRRKYQNATKWMRILKLKRSGELASDPPSKTVKGFWKLDWKFIGGQMFGCGCIAFYSACAVAIAYTTPTTGIGCRSLNFIIYAGMNCILSIIQIVRWELERAIDRPDATPDWRKHAYNLLMFVYFAFVITNFLILIAGTIGHFSGQMNRCSCFGLFKPNARIELAIYTSESIENALNYWLLIGHLSHAISWGLLVMMLVFRRLTMISLNNHFTRNFAPEDKQENKQDANGN